MPIAHMHFPWIYSEEKRQSKHSDKKKDTKLSYGRNVQETFCPNRIKRKVEICGMR